MALIKYTSIAFLVLSVFWLQTRNYDPSKEGILLVFGGVDPELRISVTQLDQAVTYPVQVENAKDVVLLVHGTGMTTQINWESTLVAPPARKGFQPCYLEIPARLSHNGQISAEYVNHAIKKVVREHPAAANDVSIISWSAGALVTQWTLTFIPRLALGSRDISFWALPTADPVQQLPWSNFVATPLKFGGGTAQVPTTNIGSSTNLIVQPSFYGGSFFGRKDSWRLDGPKAPNIDLFKVCTSRLITAGFLPRPFAHESLLWEPASHRVIFDALSNDDSSLGNPDVVSVDECKPDSAPYLKAGDKGQHAKIVPELLDFSPTMPTSGWPDVPLRDYASGLQLPKEEEADNHGKKEI
ncbi:hypothetical protein SUNI508_11492 [Seiridium unicorne]|uniref:Alpha/beta-hydrolase n=1 Tax=Seiridium unicorne TaxID=138068 RepID=A0ABR2UHI4_9PEZI